MVCPGRTYNEKDPEPGSSPEDWTINTSNTFTDNYPLSRKDTGSQGRQKKPTPVTRQATYDTTTYALKIKWQTLMNNLDSVEKQIANKRTEYQQSSPKIMIRGILLLFEIQHYNITTK